MKGMRGERYREFGVNSVEFMVNRQGRNEFARKKAQRIYKM